MEIEKVAAFLIYYVHAPLGGLALLAGGVALVAKKGNTVHKKSGMVFFYAMLISAIASFVISVLPNHENPFLFSIGLFSSYFLLTGLRSLRFRQTEVSLGVDKVIAYAIIVVGICMISYPVLFDGELNIVLSVFGFTGFVFGIRDLRHFSDRDRLKSKWLKLHLGKMSGGYIAAVSAFFVVNQLLPGIWNWFVPTIAGSVLITYWMRKVNKAATSHSNSKNA